MRSKNLHQTGRSPTFIGAAVLLAMPAAASTLLALGLAGCSEAGWPDSAASGAPPAVQNCALVGIGSPSKYVCKGKSYTSFELAKLRQDWAKAHGG